VGQHRLEGVGVGDVFDLICFIDSIVCCESSTLVTDVRLHRARFPHSLFPPSRAVIACQLVKSEG